MNPSEIAQHLPKWVIPEGTDLDRLRDATDQMIAEFSRPIRQDARAASQSSSWSYTSAGNLDHSKWFLSQQIVPRVYICSIVERLKDHLDLLAVIRATTPYGSWVVEDSLRGLYSWGEIVRLSVKARRTVRLEWLKLLKEKIDER